MSSYQFYAYETDADYFNIGAGTVLSADTLTITDGDEFLQATTATDPGTDQVFDFANQPTVTDYDVAFLDFAKVNGTGMDYELYAMSVTVSGGAVKYYVLSKDAGFIPSPGDGLAITSYSTFSSVRYDQLGSAICFGHGTLISTPKGQVAIQTLRPGDLVQTMDNGPKPLLWVARRDVGGVEMTLFSRLKPVWIKAGLFANDRPLIVSQQHKMLTAVSGQEHLVVARKLPQFLKGGARIAKGKIRMTYYHLLLDQHEILFAENAPTESLSGGPLGLAALSPLDRAKVLTDFPELFPQDAPPRLCRPLLRNKDLVGMSRAARLSLKAGRLCQVAC